MSFPTFEQLVLGLSRGEAVRKALYNGTDRVYRMTKVVVAKLKTGKPKAVSKTRVRTRAGQVMTVFTVGANTESFDDDLTRVFSENVAAARRENTRLFGSPDGGTAVRGAKSALNGARKK
jgi:hypothetical protein